MTHIAEDIHEMPTAARDMAWFFLGAIIGQGSSRKVYQHRQDKTLVIKHETHDTFQNVLEWEIWQLVKDTKHKKWFAPCIDISPNGQFLIQKKAEKARKGEYPKKVPHFFTDMKYDNFGFIGKQFVCIDYGTQLVRFIDAGLGKKMRKADWWE